MTTPAPRSCIVCGRTIEWRRKWARDWENVRYCSNVCRRRKLTPQDHALEAAIIDLLDARACGATICPSEAARRVRPDGWHDVMEDARMAARRLVVAGAVEITQKGSIVDPSTAKGPIRIRRVRSS